MPRKQPKLSRPAYEHPLALHLYNKSQNPNGPVHKIISIYFHIIFTVRYNTICNFQQIVKSKTERIQIP